MAVKWDLDWFTHQLRTVLVSMYDPSVIRNNLLTELFEVERHHNPMFALQYIILNAIEALKPTETMPVGARNWRVYQILRRRYSEQATQAEVASELGLGLRQMQREENLARQTLAEYLWLTYHLEKRVETMPAPTSPVKAAPTAEAHMPTPSEELEKLRETVPAQITDLEAVIWAALKTLKPSLVALGVSSVYNAEGNLPQIWSRGSVLQQALVSLVSLASRSVPGGEVLISPQVDPLQVCLLIQATSAPSPAVPPKDLTRSFQAVEQLMPLCRGSVEVISWGNEGKPFAAKIILPIRAEAIMVLVVDDNADTRQLFRRYLSGSQYHFVGASNPGEGLALALELAPQLIVLDVMMPGQDGWTLLGQLREHPQTEHIPVIVSTILPQEELALDLGAADFIRKPVNQAVLLSALDRQLPRILPKSY